MSGELSERRTTAESLRDYLNRLQVIADWQDEFMAWELNGDRSVVDDATACAVYRKTMRLIDEACDDLSVLAESHGIDCSPLARFRLDHNPKHIPEVEDLLGRLRAIERVVSGEHLPQNPQPPIRTGPPSVNDSQSAGTTTDEAVLSANDRPPADEAIGAERQSGDSPVADGFVPANTLWRGHFHSYRIFKTFLESHPEIARRKPSKFRLEVNAAACMRAIRKRDLDEFESLDHERMKDVVADAEATKAEIRRERGRK